MHLQYCFIKVLKVRQFLYMNIKSYRGTHTALVTPLLDDKVDWNCLEKLVDYQFNNGVDGLVSVGTTGESPTLNTKEHLAVIEKTVEYANSRGPVIAGTGANSTSEAVQLTVEADKLGANAFLIVAPYYNKPSQEGVYRHFAKIAESTEKPIVLYSIPGRCNIEVSVEVCKKLYRNYPHVAGIKEAGGSCDKVTALRNSLGEDYLILSGDDGLTIPFMGAGAEGIISVASNAFPAQVSELVQLGLKNDLQGAVHLHLKYNELFKTLFIEPNPVPIKYLMKKLGLLTSDEVRLPLCGLEQSNQAVLEAVLERSRVFFK
jgi:4-hydroxy-tetrahydrodipicolinate synthase